MVTSWKSSIAHDLHRKCEPEKMVKLGQFAEFCSSRKYPWTKELCAKGNEQETHSFNHVVLSY